MVIDVIITALAFIMSAVMIFAGYGIDTWQWWAILLIFVSGHFLGYVDGYKHKQKEDYDKEDWEQWMR